MDKKLKLKTVGDVIYCTNPYSGMTFKVSKKDEKLVKDILWNVFKNHNKVMIKKHIDGKAVYLNRLIAKAKPKDIVMFINGDAADMRRCNLRICTYNQCTKSKCKPINNTSGYKGVYWEASRNKWKASIRVNGKTKYFGLYMDTISAAEAYNQAVLKYFGKFARLNVIPKRRRIK